MRKAVVASIVAVVIILLGVGIGWLFSTGRLVYASDPAKHSATVVCGVDTVDAYNDAAEPRDVSTSEDPGVDVGAMKSLASKIKKTEGYGTDATCQTLLFWIAYYSNNLEGAKSAHAALRELHSKGRFPNSDIRSSSPLSQYDVYITALSGSDGLEQE